MRLYDEPGRTTFAAMCALRHADQDASQKQCSQAASRLHDTLPQKPEDNGLKGRMRMLWNTFGQRPAGIPANDISQNLLLSRTETIVAKIHAAIKQMVRHRVAVRELTLDCSGHVSKY